MKNLFTYVLFLTGISVFSVGCKNVKSATESFSQTKEQTEYAQSAHLTQAVLWQQNAAEYRALSYQAFNVAKMRLTEILKDETLKDQKLAIITDIDETVLDNSPSEAKMIELDEEFSQELWGDWTDRGIAKEVPGAANFLNFAHEQGVEVFYVTNRLEEEKKATLRNMKAVNFPYADNDHILLRNETSSKKDRFEHVRKDYTVVIYLGDNLSDFTHKFRATSSTERNELADDLKDRFGVDFIVLPNPMYGDWETQGVFGGKYDWSDREKDSIRKAALKSY